MPGPNGIISSAIYAGMLILGIVIGLVIEGYIARNRVESARELVRKMEEEARSNIEAENAKNKLKLQEELEEKKNALENRYLARQGELERQNTGLFRKRHSLTIASSRWSRRARIWTQRRRSCVAAPRR